jgi:hypothetical protein
MTHWYCYECKNGFGNCDYPCEYIDPIGELDNSDHITCAIGDARWVKAKCACCGHEVDE